MNRSFRRAAGYLRASPVSIAALPLAAVGAATGGRVRILGGVLDNAFEREALKAGDGIEAA